MNNPIIKVLLTLLTVAGFLLTLVPSILNWQGVMESELVNKLMLAGTVMWFTGAIFLFGRKSKDQDEKV